MFYSLKTYGFLVVSLVVVSVFAVVSVVVVGVDNAAAESVFVLSEPLPAAFSELQPIAIEPTIVATNAKLKMCFFIDISLMLIIKCYPIITP